LTDPSTGVSASITDAPFTVVEPAAENQSALTQLPAIVQDALEHPGMNTVVLILIVVFLLALAAAAIILIRRRVRTKRAAVVPASDHAV
jgi:heme/copper-type cytochrome/quinol oxidase subunit 2